MKGLFLLFFEKDFGGKDSFHDQAQKVGNKEGCKFGFGDHPVLPIGGIKKKEEDQEFQKAPSQIHKAYLVFVFVPQPEEDQENQSRKEEIHEIGREKHVRSSLQVHMILPEEM